MRSAILIGSLWLAAFGLGAASQLHTTPEQAVAEKAPAPSITHPGRTLDLLAYRLTGRNTEAQIAESELSQPVSQPSPVAAVAAPPPSPDIAALLRRDISAVLLGAAGPVLVVATSDASLAKRVLRVGDAYRSEWKVEAIDDQRISLRRGEEIRVVELHSPYPTLMADNAIASTTPADPALERLRRKSLPRRLARGETK